MNPRTHANPYLSNSLAIRQEIQRFESVHPSIYALYDLIEAIPDMLIQQQIREHVVCIEDSFVNSQEWTLSRTVPDLKLGILGTINSGKSALVHRYLTGSYLQEESPEGGRFKKEVVLDGQSYLLLIRDEGGLPEVQFTHWVDAVIFVFSLENEVSFNAIYSYYAKMAHFHANIADVPVILVGTQDAISESNPRVIDDTRARKLASDLKRCAYYETCATYGLNVERVFQDACQKIVQTRLATGAGGAGRSNTPNHMTTGVRNYHTQQSCPPPLPPYPSTHGAAGGGRSYDAQSHSSSGSGSAAAPLTPTGMAGGHHVQGPSPPFQDGGPGVREKDPSRDFRQGDRRYRERDIQTQGDDSGRGASRSHRHAVSVPIPTVPDSSSQPGSMLAFGADVPAGLIPQIPTDSQTGDVWSLSSPGVTPVMPRKLSRLGYVGNARVIPLKSSSFGRSDEVDKGMKSKSSELGSGRVIPIKQGMLYKKSSKPLSKEWKKKYVTLLDDGRLTYHPSLHDYMDNVRGKEVNLLRTTVKIPGQRPRGSEAPKPAQTNGQSTSVTDGAKDGINAESLVISNSSLAPGFPNGSDFLIHQHMNTGGPTAAGAAPVASSTPPTVAKAELPSVKKRPKRSKSGAKGEGGADGDSDGFEFMVVSLDNSTWHFEAQSQEERDDWVQAIEQQIFSSLQLNLSDKSKNRSATVTDRAVIQTIRSVRGNHYCADCECQNPDWASINLGILVCIECSGIHRNLGTHLSRVRSLDLDEWPSELVVIMTTIGNQTANSIWEANLKGRTKPTPTSPREEKEKWIRGKYEQKEFVPPPPYSDVPLPQQLIDAVARQDVHNTILVLGYCKADHVNTPYSKTDTRTALHIAAALGNLVLVQLLLWYGANAKAVDHEGHNAMYYARGANAVDCVELLRTQGCPENPTLPRRRISNPPPGGSGGSSSSGGNAAGSGEIFDKLPASVI